MVCFGLSIFRCIYTGTPRFLFLNWNLFLAFVPWALSTFVLTRSTAYKKKSAIIILIGTWLAFFPNAPYILTDLFHLRNGADMPMWFDLVLILSFAWVGLIYGILSLWDIEQMVMPKLGAVWTSTFASIFLFIASFGIYLGRYLRWNSWDILQHPSGLINDVGNRFLHPFDHPRTWGVTIFLGLFLNMVYWGFKLMRRPQIERLEA